MRLIDADALDLALGQACDAKRQTPRGCLNRFDLKDALDAAPTICCAEYADGRAESFRSLTQIRADAAIHAPIAALDAEVALRDQMLHAIWLGHKKWKVPTADTEDEWLADLRARAEKEAER